MDLADRERDHRELVQELRETFQTIDPIIVEMVAKNQNYDFDLCLPFLCELVNVPVKIKFRVY